MQRFATLVIGGETYRLRLTSSAIVAVEKKLGGSLFTKLENIKENMVETLVTILWGAMQPLQQGISMEKTYELYDAYIDEGHTLEDLFQVVMEVFEASGFFKKGQAKSLAEGNALQSN